MDPYASEKEQIEAIRKWWRENGTAIVLGVALGLAGLFGWRMWQSYHNDRADRAALDYTRMSAALAQGKLEGARQWGRQLIVDFPSTPYGTLAAFTIARIDVNQGKPKAAAKRLQWAFAHAGTDDLRRLAALRLARVQLSEHDFDAAARTLTSVEPGGFAAAFAQVQGDLYAAQGDAAKARASYETALKKLAADAPAQQRQLLQVKLDNLGGATAAQGAS